MLRRLIRDSAIVIAMLAAIVLAVRLLFMPMILDRTAEEVPERIEGIVLLAAERLQGLSLEEARAKLESVGGDNHWRIEPAKEGTREGEFTMVRHASLKPAWCITVGVPNSPFALEAPAFQPPSPPIEAVILAVIAALFLGVGCSVLLRLPDARRISLLARNARRVRSGNFEIEKLPARTDEVGRLAADFESMVSLLDAHVSRQDALITAIAHEYRTPLSTARFRIDMLAESVESQENQEHVHKTARALDRLESIVGTVLKYAEFASRGSHETEQVARLADVVRRTREDVLGESKLSIGVRVSPRIMVRSDQAHLGMMVSNLLSNASRFAQSAVEVSTQSDADGSLRICVEDDGPGIPESRWGDVLDPFVRLDEAGGDPDGGVGLGLALARQLAGLYGGRVAVGRSELGGALVSIHLPPEVVVRVDEA